MGGLGGLPFVGKTGFKAYSHHVPKDGNVFIIFAPHIGFAEDGLVGKISRAGQDHLDVACGAAIGAYNTCKNGAAAGGNDALDRDDPQFSFIIKALRPKMDQINRVIRESGVDANAATAYAMFELARDYLLKIISSDFSGKVLLLGGIQINMKRPCEDLFEPLTFECYQKGTKIMDLMQAVENGTEYH